MDTPTRPKKSKAEAPKKPNWGFRQRLEFIEFRLFWEGRLNRGDLIDFFGISRPQASLDLARYIELAPKNIRYDRKRKTYLASGTFTPAFGRAESSAAYLDLILTPERPQANFIGRSPSAEVVKYPQRRVEAQVLRKVLTAIRERLMLRIEYQSMNRPNPTSRAISPHAIAFDGFRWHARAYCHEHQAFRDFVLARILKVYDASATSIDSGKDSAWNQTLNVVVAPHPNLTSMQKRAIALDFGMKNNRKTLRTRRALAFYLLRQLGLDNASRTTEPNAQHIILVNRNEVASAIDAHDCPQ